MNRWLGGPGCQGDIVPTIKKDDECRKLFGSIILIIITTLVSNVFKCQLRNDLKKYSLLLKVYHWMQREAKRAYAHCSQTYNRENLTNTMQN